MYKEKIQSEIEKASGEDSIILERPKIKTHGDFSTNIAMILAKKNKKNPLDIAQEIKEKIKTSDLFSHVEIAKPGFINLTINDYEFAESLSELHKLNEYFGFSKKKLEEKILVEYVSSNPTGDLHIGHGRQAAIGDSLCNVLEAAGYNISREFYINDCGEQIKNLSDTAWAIYKKLKGENIEWKENYYPEETILPYVKLALENTPSPENPEKLGEIIKDKILKDQKDLLSSFNVQFDKWFSETNLHKENAVDEIIKLLEKNNYLYEQEGALWFKAKEFGDVRDRVIKKSDTRYTYLACDIAYHLNKLNRGFNHLINIWGADHHGQEIGLKGGLKACGKDGDKLEVLFVQLVSLKKGSEEVKMSKRAGTVVTVKDLLNDVGKDAFRYFLIESHLNNRMVFDVELAKKQDKDNPVFYIQYAHARTCSIFRQLKEQGKDLNVLIESFKDPKTLMRGFNVNNEEYLVTKALTLKIFDFPEEIQIAANTRSPGRIAIYLKELASDFHQFYTVCRVLTEDESLTKARLGLIHAAKITIANGLKILGISAPEKM